MAGGHETSPRQQKDTSQTEGESHNKAICHVRKTREAHIVSQVDHEDLVFVFFTPQKAEGAPARCLRGKSAETRHPASSLKYHGYP